MESAYEKLLKTEGGGEALAKEHAIAGIGELVARLLHQSGMNRKQLASKLRLSPGRITQLFDEDANLTIGTLSRILYRGFGHILEVSSRPIDDFGDGDVLQVVSQPSAQWTVLPTNYPIKIVPGGPLASLGV